jgi:nitrate reductase delta subunit
MMQDQHKPVEAQPSLSMRLSGEDGGSHTGSRQLRRAAIKAAAWLLGYPDDTFWGLLPQVEAYLCNFQDIPSMAVLARTAEALRRLGPSALAKLYVATFDFSEPTALYLTAHELGDSRQRGSALLALRYLLRGAGFEPVGAELPDYLPMLLEFLASVPEDSDMGELEHRLAVVCAQIRDKLEDEHPYKGIFTALLSMLRDRASSEPRDGFPRREEADTDELPYPLQYD